MPMTQRLARISTVPYFVVSQLSGQLNEIIRSGIDVTLISSDGPELGKLQSNLPNLRIIPIEIARSISPVQDVRALLSLYQLFRTERFDVVHSTNPKAGLLSAMASFLVRVPIRLHTFTGQPWVHLKGPVRWFALWSDWLIGKLNTHCYVDSESQRQFLVAQGVIALDRISVIGAGSIAGVDLERFAAGRFSEKDRARTREELGIPENASVLLFVGRITADKGVRELLAAFREIKQTGNLVHLVFVGPFDVERAAGNEITRSIIDDIPDTHVVGYTGQPEVYMATADILCLPSYREGFGTVVIEAAAMGVPTVGTNIYGITDAVVDGETGVLVAPRDPTALASALISLLENPARCREMGGRARRRAESLFDAKQVNAKVIEEYCRLSALNSAKAE